MSQSANNFGRKVFAHRRRSQFVAGMLLSVLAGAAYSQTTASNNAAPDSASASPTLEAITVTAERREESLVKAPMTVSVLSGPQLQVAGVTDSLDLSLVTPGLKYVATGGTTSPFIRGVGTLATAAGDDPNVATYIDGIYQNQQTALAFQLPDVQSIQVVKGPQGTLYGRNAMGGAILVTTQQPSFTPSGNVSVSYGNYDSVSVSGFGTMPIIPDKLAGAISAYMNKDDGYDRNIVTGQDAGLLSAWGVRGKLLFDVTDDFTIKGTAYFTYQRDQSLVWGSNIGGNTEAKLIPGATYGTQPYQAAADAGVDSFNRGSGYALTFDYDFHWADLTSTVTYTQAANTITLDADYSTAPLLYFTAVYPDENIEWENIFKSNEKQRFRWLVGTFLYHDSTGYNPGVAGSVFGDPANFESRSKQLDDAYAGFTSLDYDITDALTATAGVRVGNEHRRFYGAPGSVATPPTVLPELGEKSWNSVTPRAVLRYALDANSNVYVSFAEGYHSGVFDGFGLDKVPVDPETLKTYEVGFKTDNGRWAFNVAPFYQREYNQQATAYAFNGLIYASILVNAGTAEMYGVDSDFHVQITDAFNMVGGGEYLHATYLKFPNAIINVPNTACPAGTYPCGNITLNDVNLKGYTLQQSPEFTAYVTGNYTQDIGIGKFTASMTASYIDRYFVELGDRVAQDAYVQFNGQVSLKPAGTNWTVALWGRNLSNRTVIESTYVSNFGDAAAYAEPRTYGIRVGYSF